MTTVADQMDADFEQMKAENPPELAWARRVLHDFTTFSRRTYGIGTTFCSAEMDVVDAETGRAFLVDPFPKPYYPRGVLLFQLADAKRRNPNLIIATHRGDLKEMA